MSDSIAPKAAGQPEMQGTIELRVKYCECDPMGYVHHSRYFQYFEMGRTELLRSWGIRYRDLEDAGAYFAVFKAKCKYLLPLRYDDVFQVETTIKRMTRARIDHTYRIRREGRTVAEAATTLACVDGDGKIIPIPDELVPDSY